MRLPRSARALTAIATALVLVAAGCGNEDLGPGKKLDAGDLVEVGGPSGASPGSIGSRPTPAPTPEASPPTGRIDPSKLQRRCERTVRGTPIEGTPTCKTLADALAQCEEQTRGLEPELADEIYGNCRQGIEQALASLG